MGARGAALAIRGAMPSPLAAIPVRTPKQSRSRASFEKVTAAARRLLETQGYEGITLQDVVRESGVSIGSIYGRVASKEDLLRVVQAQVLAEVEVDQSVLTDPARWSEGGLRELLPKLIDAFAEFLRERAPILRAFMTQANVDPQIGDAGRRSGHLLGECFVALLLTRREEITHADPERAARACFVVSYSALGRYLGLGSSAEAAGEGNWTLLKEDIGDLCVSYLLDARPR